MAYSFFQDERGNYSLMRLQCALNTFFSFILSLYAIINDPSLSKDLAIAYLAISTGGKIWQKAIENSPLSPNSQGNYEKN